MSAEITAEMSLSQVKPYKQAPEYQGRLIVLAVLLGVACLCYMTLGSRGNWGFVLPFRGVKLIALVLVGLSVSTSTVLFQTITQNHILTPSIMGFDSLYVLILTTAVYFLGGFGFLSLPPMAVFLFNVAVLILAALALFGTLLWQSRGDLMKLLLTGVICATLFRALTSFMQRMIDPNEYTVIQAGSYARFNQIEGELLALAAALLLGAIGLAWRMRFRLNVLALGHDAAINLGEDPKRGQYQVLILVAVLVSVSTALVGPVAFLGLIVVSLARLITPCSHHSVLLPSAGLIACVMLVGGQTVMERVLHLSTPLPVVIDFLGGVVFLFLVLTRARA